MSNWNLATILSSLHTDIQGKLDLARSSFAHPGVKGDASETVWLTLLQTYLPKRYQAETAHVVDSEGKFSDQIDVVVFDRQYSPFIFNFQGQKVIPAESVYAVFEAKQTVDAALIAYAQEKVASVRALSRTSLPIPHAGGVYKAKEPFPVLGGILSFESEWTPALGAPLERALSDPANAGRLDLGCIAAHGHFNRKVDDTYEFVAEGKPATAFLFKLIEKLQFGGTVPMIDIGAYARWLAA